MFPPEQLGGLNDFVFQIGSIWPSWQSTLSVCLYQVDGRSTWNQVLLPALGGDEIFVLNDEDERAAAPSGLLHFFHAPEVGFSPAAQHITDHTEVLGFFQSEKYYADKTIVRSWFRFAEHITAPVHELYDHMDLSHAVSLSLRI